MSEHKTKSSMILHGFLFGLTASSTVVYGWALAGHWAMGLRTSAIDEMVFIATVLATVFYGQSFFSSYQAYQRIYAQALPSITMYVPTTPLPNMNEKFVFPLVAGAGGGIGSQPMLVSPASSRSSMGSPNGTVIGTPTFSPDGAFRYPAVAPASMSTPSPIALHLPTTIHHGKPLRSVSPHPAPRAQKPNGEHNRRCSDAFNSGLAEPTNAKARSTRALGEAIAMSREDLVGYEWDVSRGRGGDGLMGLGMGAIDTRAGLSAVGNGV